MARLILLLIGTAVLIATLTPPALAQAPRRGGVFRVPVPEAPTLDPHQTAGFVTQVYASLVYGHLVRFPSGPEAQGPADHRILPDVAEKWEFPTPTTVVFRLRKGVRFHRKPPVDGREVTADDVKFSLGGSGPSPRCATGSRPCVRSTCSTATPCVWYCASRSRRC